MNSKKIIPEAKNNRHLISSTQESSSALVWARMLKEEFENKNYKIPTKRAPKLILRVGSIFDKSLCQVNILIKRDIRINFF